MKRWLVIFSMHLVSSIIFLLFLFIKAEGQFITRGSTYVIKIDSLTRQPDKSVPIDQPFTIVLTPRNPQAITDITAMPVIRNKKGKPVPVGGIPDYKISSFKVLGPQVVIEFPAVKPDFSFDIYITRKLDSSNLSKFLNFSANIVYTALIPAPYTDMDKQNIENNYRSFIQSLNGKQSPRYPLAISTYDYLFQTDCEANRPALTDCDVRSLQNHLNSPITINILSIINRNIVPGAYGGVSDFLTDLKIISKVYRTEKLSDMVISSIIRIWSAPPVKMNDFFQGLISADFQNQTVSSKIEDIVSRQKNFQLSYQRFSDLQDTIQRMQNELPIADPAFGRVITYLNDIVGRFFTAKTLTDKNIANITESLLSAHELDYFEYYANNSDGFKDLQSASTAFFSPQVGISSQWLPKNTGGHQAIEKLVLGVNINFRSVNKNLVRRDITTKDWRNYFSGFVGLTFGSYSDSQYNNLFGSNTLLAGLNYRVTRSFYVSFGASALRQQNKNPVINSFHNEFGGFLALLLDLDITNAASNFISYFTK